MCNILFFDFDNTLFSHQKNMVSPAVQAALSRLHRSHNILVVASGRGPESEDFILGALQETPDYLILMNGQIIRKGHKQLYENFAQADKMQAIMDLAERNSFPCGGYYAGGILVNRISPRVETVWRDFGTQFPCVIPHFQRQYSLYQGHLYITESEAELFAAHLENYVTNWSHSYLLNLIPREAGKSQAIQWLLNFLSVDKTATYAFGDGFNDVDMLQAVHHGVAMGNAGKDLKSVAEYVTSSVEEDGVVSALQHYKLI